ncbi:MAG: DUF5399 family protein [Chlamydiota bacterium]
MGTRTIDNLGHDASERYAQDQKILDGQEKIPQEAKMIFTKTSIEVTKPTFHLETDLAFHGSLKSNSWAEFLPPLGYESQKRFFTHELLPSFTNQEKTEALKNKILEMKKKEQDDALSDEQENPSSKKENWQKIKEEEEEEKEKEVLINLLNCILHLDNCIIYVHAKRSQYHKG